MNQVYSNKKTTPKAHIGRQTYTTHTYKDIKNNASDDSARCRYTLQMDNTRSRQETNVINNLAAAATHPAFSSTLHYNN